MNNGARSRVLFVCVHNSARSQMAEAFLNGICPEDFVAESAGLEPGTLNPLVVQVMNEVGIDISGNQTKSAFELYRSGTIYSHVITLCDQAHGEKCPVFPGFSKRLDWSFPDPSTVTGTHEERLDKVREIRGQIEQRIRLWCGEMCLVPQ